MRLLLISMLILVASCQETKKVIEGNATDPDAGTDETASSCPKCKHTVTIAPPDAPASSCTTTMQSASPFAGGDGSQGDPYLICTKTQMEALASNISTYYQDHFKLMDNLDYEGERFPTIGNSTDYFNGTFDGNNYHIVSPYFKPATSWANRDYIAMFYNLGSDAVVKNLVIRNAEAFGNQRVAFIAGGSEGEIENIYVSGIIRGDESLGGVVGLASLGTIKNVKASVSINATDYYTGTVAGKIENDSLIDDVEVEGLLSVQSYAGGVVGSANESSIQNVVVKNITMTAYSEVGAVVGEFNGSSNQTLGYSLKNLEVKNAYIVSSGRVGGLAGLASNALIHSGYVHNIEIFAFGNGSGGLIGEVEKSEIYSLATKASVFSANYYAAICFGKFSRSTVSRVACYGEVSGSVAVGGFAGFLESGVIDQSLISGPAHSDGVIGHYVGETYADIGMIVSNNHYNADEVNSSVSDVVGSDPATPPMVSPLPSTFTTSDALAGNISGLDFSTDWTVDPEKFDGMPMPVELNADPTPENGKYLFVTDKTYDGFITGATPADKVYRADLRCNDTTDNNHPNNGSTYKALIAIPGARQACDDYDCSSSTTSDPDRLDWPLAPNQKYIVHKRTLNRYIGETNAQALLPNRTYAGIDLDAGQFWTGMFEDWNYQYNDNGTPTENNCSGWTVNNNSNYGKQGSATKQNLIMDDGINQCDYERAYLCVEQ